MISFLEAQKITQGKVIQIAQDRPVIHLITDSRKSFIQDGTVFLAIAGDRHDGHQYIQELYAAGIRQFIVEKDVNLAGLDEANFLLVHSTVKALQLLAVHHRSMYTIPVIGITGSNGKTIVKEWLFQLLSRDLSIVKNPGSYNSQIGVPLSIWQMQSYHELGIFEAGISKTSEMKQLAEIIQPSLGIFTNIGPAHNEGFSDLTEKIFEKITLFEKVQKLIYCRDHVFIHEVLRTSSIPTFSWGYGREADMAVERLENDRFHISYSNRSFNLLLPFSDPASVENCFHCIALMLYYEYAPDVIQNRISALKSVPMRLELREGMNHCYIIDDTYNNDLSGLQISLEFLATQYQKNKKRLILSDILQSGLSEQVLVNKIGQLVGKSSINSFIGIGPILKKFQSNFKLPSTFFKDTEEFLRFININEFENEIILIKGARKFQFEKIVNLLQRKVHGTVMEINLDAMVHNLNYFRSKLNPGTKIMVMVKAFAYGSGSTEVANLLQYHKVDYLGVAYTDEGIDLRRSNITLPILVMNPSEESFGTLLRHNLEPEVYSFKILRGLISFLEGKACKIHIKLDTGMHRLGFDETEIDALISLLQANPNLTVASIFSHLAAADEASHDSFSRQQADTFSRGAEKIAAAIGYSPLTHILNSSGILRLTDLQMGMFRLGIGLYGIDPTTENSTNLHPVVTLKTVISQIKHISQGETVGYGRKGEADKDIALATIAIGYADGFSRAFSQGIGEVLINGKRAPVVGNVCMDMTMVNITGIEAKEGDEVIIFGNSLSIQEVARKINTIPYEILTNTSDRVKRVFIAESI